MIHRELARPPIDEMQNGDLAHRVDARKISRYVHTLCRIVKTRQSAPDTFDPEMSATLREMLSELRNPALEEEEPP